MIDLTEFEKQMKEAESYLEDVYSEIRAGRANPNILNRVMVEYYGTSAPIKQVAGISVPEARVILIQPWEQRLLGDIQKAIMDANIGITPVNDGKSLRLIFPDLTEDRRKEISKEVRKKAEDAKISIRNIRRDGNEHIAKKGKEENISEDEIKKIENDMQKLTDKYIDIIDNMMQAKEKEIMTV